MVVSSVEMAVDANELKRSEPVRTSLDQSAAGFFERRHQYYSEKTNMRRVQEYYPGCKNLNVLLKLFNYYFQAATVLFAWNSIFVHESNYNQDGAWISLEVAFLPWFLASGIRFAFLNRMYDLSAQCHEHQVRVQRTVNFYTLLVGAAVSLTQMFQPLNLYNYLSSTEAGFVTAGMITLVHAMIEIQVVRKEEKFSVNRNFRFEHLFPFTGSNAWKEKYGYGFLKGIVESIEMFITVLAVYALIPSESQVRYLPIVSFLSWQLSNLMSYCSLTEMFVGRLVPDTIFQAVMLKYSEEVCKQPSIAAKRAADKNFKPYHDILCNQGLKYVSGNMLISLFAASGFAIPFILNLFNSGTSTSSNITEQNSLFNLAFYSSVIVLTNLLNVGWYRERNRQNVHTLFQPSSNVVADYESVPSDPASASAVVVAP